MNRMRRTELTRAGLASLALLPGPGLGAADALARPPPSRPAATWRLENDSFAGQFGHSLAAGDLNGDGFSDVVVGARVYPKPYWRAGRVAVYLGGADGLPTTPSWTAEGTEPEERFAETVACGDFNGDGFADLLVGSWMHEKRRGGVWLFLGSPDGPHAQADWHLEGEVEGLSFGYAVGSVGDLNGDGFADALVGAPFHSETDQREGRLYAFYGGPAGLRQQADWCYQSNRKATGLVSDVATAGDVNGDGYDDLLVGAPKGEEHLREEGKVFLFLGTAQGLKPHPAWLGRGNVTDGWFGASLSGAGDVNGDGFADVVVGATRFTGPATNFVRAYLYKGCAAGLSTNASWMIETDQAFAAPGITVQPAGDVNADGYADVCVASWFHKSPQKHEGHVLVFPGSADGLPGSMLRAGTPDLAVAWWPGPPPSPWWRSAWALNASLGMLVAVGFGAVRWVELRRVKLRLRLAQRDRALEQERLRIARDLHDELGAGLTRVMLFNELVRRELGPPHPAAPHVDQIAASMRELTRAVEEIVWAVNPRKDNLEEFVGYLCAYTEEFLKPTSLRCRLDIPPDIPSCAVPSQSRHELFLVLKEALTNVVRHAGATEVRLGVRLDRPCLVLTVEDDGKGINSHAVQPGADGLANMRRRAERLGGEFAITSRPGGGTCIRVIVRLPTPPRTSNVSDFDRPTRR